MRSSWSGSHASHQTPSDPLSLYWLCTRAEGSLVGILDILIHFALPGSQGPLGMQHLWSEIRRPFDTGSQIGVEFNHPPPLHHNPTHPLKRHFVLLLSDGSVSGEGWGLNIHIWGGGNASGPLRRGTFHISRCDAKLNLNRTPCRQFWQRDHETGRWGVGQRQVPLSWSQTTYM